MYFIEWELLRVGAYCEVKKQPWTRQINLEKCIEYCDNSGNTIAVYNLNTQCACCHDPPGAVSEHPGYKMYKKRQ